METQSRTGDVRSINAAAAPEITAGIEDVLGDVTYRDRARDIAAEMAATPTVEEVLTRIVIAMEPISSR